ncbi:permease-like cell division protein FtsX [Utexia brackfieldae]|uniref:permease-like cell division protein FtsX n=1 Tax=Utexia brackfieldae TaxID=3074108 RepID=UPI00370D83F9
MAIKKQSEKHVFFHRWCRQINYAWRNVFNDIRQHLLASILTIIVIAISITLPTICYLLWKNVNQAAHQWYPTPNLTAYLNKDISPEQTAILRAKITAFPEVEKLTYLSRDETLEEFQSWSGFSDAIELLAQNPLPAVMIVIPTDDAKQTIILHDLQKKIAALANVDDVRLDDSWFTRLTALTGMVGTIAWTLSILMIIAVSLVIGNSIRLMIFARRQTITVMQLIGATEGFILRPFLYSGMFHGLVSAILALVLSEIFIFRIDSIILNVSSIFGTIFTMSGLSWDESLFIILLSTILGWFSAWVATKKYLRITNK